MPFGPPTSPGDGGNPNSTFKINPDHVHQVGQKIANDAQNDLNNPDNDAGTLFGSLLMLNPQVAQDALDTFGKNYMQSYRDLLSRRTDIGTMLQDAGTAAQQNEFSTAQMFDPTLESSRQTIS